MRHNRPPRIAFSGDEELGATYLRLGKTELYRTQQLAELMGVKTYGRTYDVFGNGSLIIETNVSPAGDTVRIFAKSFVPKLQDLPKKEQIRIFRCTPGFLINQKDFLLDDQFRFPSTVDDSTNPPTIIPKTDTFGQLVSPAWEEGRIDHLNVKKLSNGKNSKVVIRGYNGGWWGLRQAKEENLLTDGYKKCDILTWSGVASNFCELPTVSPFVDSSAYMAWKSSGEAYMVAPGLLRLRTHICFYGIQIDVYSDQLDGNEDIDMPKTHVLGACILRDDTKEKEYFYVLTEYVLSTDAEDGIGDIDTTRPAGGSHMRVLRYPVKKALNEGGITEGWETVGTDILYTEFGDSTPPSSDDNDHFELPYSTAHVSYDGIAYIMRVVRKEHPTKLDQDRHFRGENVLIRIDMSDATRSVVDPNDKPGHLLWVFGGLDQLYTYRVERTNENYKATTNFLDTEITAQAHVEIVCYENDVELSRIVVVDQDSFVEIRLNSKTRPLIGDARFKTAQQRNTVGTLNQRSIFFHHPKMPTNWFYIEKLSAYDGLYVITTYNVIENGVVTSTREFDNDSVGVDYYVAGTFTPWFKEIKGAIFEQNTIGASTEIGTGCEEVFEEGRPYINGGSVRLDWNNADISIGDNLQETSYGPEHQYTSFKHNVAALYPELLFASAFSRYTDCVDYLSTTSVWAGSLFSTQLANLLPSEEAPPSFNLTLPSGDVVTVSEGFSFRVVQPYSVVHRPEPAKLPNGDPNPQWAYIFQIPRVQLYSELQKPWGFAVSICGSRGGASLGSGQNVQVNDYLNNNFMHPSNSGAGPADVLQVYGNHDNPWLGVPDNEGYQYRRILGYPFWSAQASLNPWDPASEGNENYDPYSDIVMPQGPAYFIPLGWETKNAINPDNPFVFNGYPTDGLQDVAVYSNVLTLAEFKTLLDLDEDYLWGLGVI